jgi:hypothetical protein
MLPSGLVLAAAKEVMLKNLMCRRKASLKVTVATKAIIEAVLRHDYGKQLLMLREGLFKKLNL